MDKVFREEAAEWFEANGDRKGRIEIELNMGTMKECLDDPSKLTLFHPFLAFQVEHRFIMDDEVWFRIKEPFWQMRDRHFHVKNKRKQFSANEKFLAEMEAA